MHRQIKRDFQTSVKSFCSFILIIGLQSGLKAGDEPVSVLDARISGHIHPSICQTKDGTLVVVYKGANVLMRSRSTDLGQTWEKPVEIPTSAKRPDVIRKVKKFEVYPGTADVLPDDRILVTWNYIADDKVTDGYYERALLYTISDDQGLSWSEQGLIGPVDGKHLGAVRHNVLNWGSGQWLLPLRVGPPRVFDPKSEKLTVFPLIGPDKQQYEFQQIVRTANGTLVAMSGPVVLRSTNNGVDWTPVKNFPAKGDARDNAEGRYLTVLAQGGMLVTWGVGNKNKGLRYSYSGDDGQTWTPDGATVLLPETNVTARYYSARTIQIDDEHVGTVFMNRNGIHFLKVKIERFKKSS